MRYLAWLLPFMVAASINAQFIPVEPSGESGQSSGTIRPPTLLPDGRVFLFHAEHAVERFDPTTRLFTVLGTTVLKTGVDIRSTALGDGRVLITGGKIDNLPVATAQIWDPVSGQTRQISNMVYARNWHAALRLPSGKVLIAGGESPDSARTWELFDPSVERFQAGGTLPVELWQPIPFLLADGRVFLLGGAGSVVMLPDEKTTVPGPNVDRIAGSSFELLSDDKLLVTGGFTGNFIAASEAFLWDLRTGTKTSLSPLKTPRFNHTSTRLPSGKVLIAGGSSTCSGGCTPVGAAEVFDPVSRTFSSVLPMVYPRYGHSAVRLLTGDVLFVGGSVSSSSRPLAELFTAEGSQGGCVFASDRLCLQDGRFSVRLTARDPRTARSASGRVIAQEAVFGYFSLPELTGNLSNAEVFVKILDGRAITNHWWVFYAGLTDLELWLTVRDEHNATEKVYHKEPYSFSANGDTSAF